MNEPTAEDRGAQVLADFQEAINDQDALLRDPEAYVAQQVERVKEAAQQGVIGVEDVRELLEWADAAQAWAVEELLTRELNQ